MKRISRWAMAVVAIAAGLLALSGQWRDPWLWGYIAVFAAIGGYAMLTIGDDLARERFKPPSSGADRTALRMIRLVAVLHLILAVLDSGRFHWTFVPGWLRATGLIGFAAGFMLVVRSMLANRFFSAVVRVQSDRGHHVIDVGPYAMVRHPGYAGMIVAIPMGGLALGSWIGFALGFVYSTLIFRRVLFEDSFLRTNLEGYADYARRVPHRLVPGLW
jgi:protein-S-isoprenylcysteine O-methyltransferase Ste14